MTTLLHPDGRFDEAEAEVGNTTPWRFREPDMPNPLTIVATDWATAVTKLGEAEFLAGQDRDGKRWSVLVGSVVLTKRLIDGLVEEWDEAQSKFVVVETLGRVKAGEVVSIRFIGDVDGARFRYPNFRVSRKPPRIEPAPDDQPANVAGDDDIPY